MEGEIMTLETLNEAYWRECGNPASEETEPQVGINPFKGFPGWLGA